MTLLLRKIQFIEIVCGYNVGYDYLKKNKNVKAVGRAHATMPKVEHIFSL